MDSDLSQGSKSAACCQRGRQQESWLGEDR